MDTAVAPRTGTTSPRPESIGRVVSINGSQASVELVARALRDDTPTVGKFMGLKTSKAVVIGLITEVTEQPLAPATGSQTFRKVASLDLIASFTQATTVRCASSEVSQSIRISATPP